MKENILKLSVNSRNSNKKRQSAYKSKFRTKEADLRENVFFNGRIMLILISVIIIFAVFLISLSTKAEGSATPEYKYYKSIEVKSGDTLWSIAEKYMDDDYSSAKDYIKEVKYINSMDTDHITSGKSIVIPYYSSELH